MRRVVAALAVIAMVGAFSAPAPAGAEPGDALHRKIFGELDSFVSWLGTNHVAGFVGEIGWPDDAGGDADQWNELASEYYDKLDQAGVSAMVWATGEWWPRDYKLAAYEETGGSEGVDSPNTQAPVIEAHPSTDSYLRGVDVATGTFCEADHGASRSWFSNHLNDRYGRCYIYDNQNTFEFLASRGIDTIKIEFRWELLQKKLGGKLDPTEIRRLTRAVDAARAAGLKVILSMHNFGAYFLWNGEEGVRRTVGTRKVPISDLQDVWKRISRRFAADPGVYYAIMCEPVRMKTGPGESGAELWERVSQRVVSAIRSTGDDKLIFVSGYRWSALAGWAERHPEPWIDDPANNVMYEAHHYWDRDGSGTYAHTYSEEVADAEANGY